MRVFKWINIILLMSLTMGFRLWFIDYRWAISEEDPYLWIKPCDYTKTFTNNDIVANDYLAGISNPTMTDVVLSIADHVNSIYGSYLRLEIYPEDTSDLTLSPNFNAELAATRTINFCAEDLLVAGGGATPEFSGKTVVGCTIEYDPDSEGDLRDFVNLLAHELGHCIGLDHPQPFHKSLMSYFTDPDDIYSFMEDDKQGIRHLYPASVGGLSHEEQNTLGLQCSMGNS